VCVVARIGSCAFIVVSKHRSRRAPVWKLRAKIPVELNPVAPPVHSEARPRAAKGTEMAPEDYSRSSIYSLATGQGSGASPRVDNPPGPRFPGPNFARLLIDNANPPSPDNSPLIPPARPRR